MAGRIAGFLDRVVALGKRPTIVDLRGQNQLAKRLLEAKKRAKSASKGSVKESLPMGRRIMVPLKEQNGKEHNGNGKAKQPACNV